MLKKIIFSAYLYEKQVTLLPYIGVYFVFQRLFWQKVCIFFIIVLNLPVTMRYRLLFFILVGCCFILGMVHYPLLRLRVDSPKEGDVLQGIVEIIGSTTANGFQSSEIVFAFQGSEPMTWFLIQQSTEPVQDGVLAQWDTTVISDGDYQLRVIVNLINGQKEEVRIKGLRVRNYTAVETNTAISLSSLSAPITSTVEVKDTASVSPTLEFRKSPNPAHIGGDRLLASVVAGALVVTVLFLLIGLYVWLGAAKHR